MAALAPVLGASAGAIEPKERGPLAGILPPVLSGVFPPGVTIGGTSEWAISGRGLGAVERFLVSGEDVEVVKIGRRSDGSVGVTVRALTTAGPGFRTIRGDGPAGVSNLVLFRVARQPQAVEREPNDEAVRATAMEVGTAVAGTLAPRDLDHFRFVARRGRRLTIEVEARRLGTPVSAVVTLFAPTGAALAQARETPGCDGDTRLTFMPEADGAYVLQVRDDLYGGSAWAHYRLTVDAGPFATGLFPLGGPPGGTVVVTASGGNLKAPRSRRLTLPDEPGSIVEVGPIGGDGDAVAVPQTLVVGERGDPEVFEAGHSPTTLPFGATANGRIALPNERDVYRVPVRAGDRVRVRVSAAALGSWLDSVVTVRDAEGRTLAENDDPAPARTTGVAPATDSVLQFQAERSEDLRVEIEDRYGDGGPEYAYRLTVGAPVPEVRASFRLPRDPASMSTPDALNLRAGESVALDVLVEAEGRTGPISVRAEGLPRGVSARPVSIRAAGRPDPGSPPPPRTGRLVLQAAPDAVPSLGALRVMVSWPGEGGTTRGRPASTWVIPAPGGAVPPNRPVVRELREVPVKVLAASGT